MSVPEADQTSVERRIDWFAASAGLVLAVAFQMGGSLVLFQHGGSLVTQEALAFVVLVAAGLVAGRLGPQGGGVWNGMLVAIGFIVVEALARTITDARLLGPAAGSHGSDMGGLVIGDVIVLSGGTLGGWLSRFARMRIAR
jgi:hypothetical protein